MYLNLGCGNRFCQTWTNVDFISKNSSVLKFNLVQGISFPDASFNVAYHSHLLEHFSKAKALFFIQECRRVLRPQGIIRIAVPDLEQIIRSYIFALEQALAGSQEATDNYTWLLLELFDQMVRTHTGGEMAAYLQQAHIPNEAFVLQRCGLEAENLISASRSQQPTNSTHWIKSALKPAYRLLQHPQSLRELLLRLALGKTEYQSLLIGRFRQGGEVHQWMYDRYSLTTLLKECGFEQIVQRSASESYIPNWTDFNLDTEPDGSVYKPDSLFMEAIKPLE